jgi:outer membrane protein TolC
MSFFRKRAAGIVIGIVMLSAIQQPLFAQHRQGYSLPELTDAAVHHLPAILQKQALVNSAKANITDARHAALPSLKLSDQMILASANGAPGTYLPLGAVSTAGAIRSSNLYQPATGNIAMLYGEYELVNFGLRKARVQDAVVNEQLAASDLARDQYLLKLQVGKLYFSILKDLYQLGIDGQNINRYTSIYTVIQALARSGIKAGVDSSLAQAELSKSRISYNQLTGEVQQLQQQLSFLTGITDSVMIDTTVKRYAGAPPTAWDTLTDAASSPLIDYYRKQQDVYLAAGNLIRKSYLPKILLAGGFWGRGTSVDYTDDYNYKALSAGLGYQRFNYAIGLSFVYNLFDGVHRRDKLAVNKYRMQAGNYGLQQQEQSLNTVLRQAGTAIGTALHNLQELPAQLDAAENAYNQKLAQYKAGIINLVDLTNASFVLYRAQTDYVEALNDWLQANLDKAAATGNLDLFIQSVKN